MKDSTELHTANLEMKGGLNGIDYPQNFVRAPKSAFPTPAPKDANNVANDLAMKVTMGC